MSERNRDPGAPLDGQGIPDTADDQTPERSRLPDPDRYPTPTEAPVVSTSFGTTAEEQAEGESLERKLTREEQQPTGERRREGEVDEWPEEAGTSGERDLSAEGLDGDDIERYERQAERDLSPYERDLRAGDEDLAEHERLEERPLE